MQKLKLYQELEQIWQQIQEDRSVKNQVTFQRVNKYLEEFYFNENLHESFSKEIIELVNEINMILKDSKVMLMSLEDFKKQQVDMLVEVTVQNRQCGSGLKEKLLENRGWVQEYVDGVENKKKLLNELETQVTFLLGREVYKKTLYSAIIFILGLVDFCLLLRKFKIL